MLTDSKLKFTMAVLAMALLAAACGSAAVVEEPEPEPVLADDAPAAPRPDSPASVSSQPQLIDAPLAISPESRAAAAKGSQDYAELFGSAAGRSGVVFIAYAEGVDYGGGYLESATVDGTVRAGIHTLGSGIARDIAAAGFGEQVEALEARRAYYNGTEQVAGYIRNREYLDGFTPDEAPDGSYFVRAAGAFSVYELAHALSGLERVRYACPGYCRNPVPLPAVDVLDPAASSAALAAALSGRTVDGADTALFIAYGRALAQPWWPPHADVAGRSGSSVLGQQLARQFWRAGIAQSPSAILDVRRADRYGGYAAAFGGQAPPNSYIVRFDGGEGIDPQAAARALAGLEEVRYACPGYCFEPAAPVAAGLRGPELTALEPAARGSAAYRGLFGGTGTETANVLLVAYADEEGRELARHGGSVDTATVNPQTGVIVRRREAGGYAGGAAARVALDLTEAGLGGGVVEVVARRADEDALNPYLKLFPLAVVPPHSYIVRITGSADAHAAAQALAALEHVRYACPGYCHDPDRPDPDKLRTSVLAITFSGLGRISADHSSDASIVPEENRDGGDEESDSDVAGHVLEYLEGTDLKVTRVRATGVGNFTPRFLTPCYVPSRLSLLVEITSESNARQLVSGLEEWEGVETVCDAWLNWRGEAVDRTQWSEKSEYNAIQYADTLVNTLPTSGTLWAEATYNAQTQEYDGGLGLAELAAEYNFRSSRLGFNITRVRARNDQFIIEFAQVIGGEFILRELAGGLEGPGWTRVRSLTSGYDEYPYLVESDARAEYERRGRQCTASGSSGGAILDPQDAAQCRGYIPPSDGGTEDRSDGGRIYPGGGHVTDGGGTSGGSGTTGGSGISGGAGAIRPPSAIAGDGS